MIFTFYSYKGGVGRSMALANVAELFYRLGRKVLIVDWDLEAPGIERFFFSDTTEILANQGILDLILNYKDTMTKEWEFSNNKELPFLRPKDVSIEIYKERNEASLSLITAGRRAEDSLGLYAREVLAFDWQDFYENWEGEIYFEWLVRQFEDIADVILIDSRTGVTEMGGVCTYQLADVIVMFCAPNQQNVDGTYQMALNFIDPQVTVLRQGRPIELLIIPSRIERAESQALDDFQSVFIEKFNKLFYKNKEVGIDSLWQLGIPYVPKYAYKELVAVREEGRASAADMARVYESLTYLLEQLRLGQMRPTQRLDVFYKYFASLKLIRPNQHDEILAMTSIVEKYSDSLKSEKLLNYARGISDFVERKLESSASYFVRISEPPHKYIKIGRYQLAIPGEVQPLMLERKETTKNKRDHQNGFSHNYEFEIDTLLAGRYKVLSPLGYGAFSEVYLCADIDLYRRVVIKVITSFVGAKNALEEADVAARLRHSNIISLMNIEHIREERPILVYDYISGISLEAHLEKSRYHRLELNEETVKIIRDVAQALDYAHSKNVIHRDVKPSNIILETNKDSPKAYLTDFGLAELSSPREGESMISVELRQRLSGILPYMAPEWLHDENQRGATIYSDQYSLGVTVYEMLTGRLPYQGRDANLIIQIATTEPMPPTVANPDLPEGLAPVLLKALNKEPKNRYQNCREFANEIEQAAQAYINAGQKYETALAHLAAGEWRNAISLLESIQRETPRYKETVYQLDLAQKKVRSLDLYEEAQSLISQASYQEALDKLNLLSEIDPEFEVAALRREAVQKQAAQRHENLDQMYQQAVAKFKQERYRDVLAAMALIREEKPDYEDQENIEKASQAIVDRQQKLRELYNQGKLLAQQEEWGQALESFKALEAEEAEYEDLEIQLAMVKLLGRLSTLLREATELFEGGSYTATIDRLDRLVDIDNNYKAEQVAALRQQAVNQLYQQSDRYYTAGRYEESLDLLKALQQRQPGYEGIPDLEEKNQEGIRQRDLRKHLDQLYDEAKTALNEKNYEAALHKWQEIQAQKADLFYEDKEAVAERAVAGLYTAGLGLLGRQPKQAIAQLERIRYFEPDFVDSEQLESQARAAIERRNLSVRVVNGAGIVVALVFVAGWLMWDNSSKDQESQIAMTMTAEAVVVANVNGTPTSTATATFTPTSTQAPTTTVTPTVTATATVTPTPTHTSTATATLANIATALQDSSIFEEPDENSEQLTFVRSGEVVIVLEQQGSWIRVVDAEGVEGWAAANRFEITIGVPTNTPGAGTATAHSSATIYAGPGTNYSEITFINAGTVVTVLGRSSNNSWLFIRTLNEIEGWVAASLVNYPGVMSSLPVVNEIVTVTPNSGDSNGGNGGSLQGLTFDFWPLTDQFTCTATGWTQLFFMEGHGGDGRYSYYINGQRVNGPVTSSYTYQLSAGGTATIQVTGRVTSGDGQSQEIILFVNAPDCN